MSIYTAYANSIVLKIDEASRSLTNNDGSTTPIILGVRGDDCAERIYFESPKQLSPEIDLLESSETVKIHVYVNYRNAVNEPYIQECTDVAESTTSDTVNFSWIVTNKATVNRGDVKFNICVKRTVYNAETDKWELTNEWHTTTFVGKVLDGIDVTKKTPEVITHDSVTIEQLTVQTNAYAAAVNGYATEVNALHKTLDDVNAYVDSVVDSSVETYVNNKMTDYLLADDYWSEHENIVTDIDNRLSKEGGQMNGNIEFAGGGIVYNNPQQTASDVAGGWIFNVNGYPMIVSDELKICACTEYDPFLMPLTYNLPAESGTLARLEDIPEIPVVPKYYEHRVRISGKGSGNSSEYLFTLITKSATAFTTLSSLVTELIKRGAIDHISYIPATGMHKVNVNNAGYHVFGIYARSEGDFLEVCYYSSDPDEENGGYFMDFNTIFEDSYTISDSFYEIR